MADTPDPALWMTVAQAAEARDFDQTFAAIAAHTDVYATLLADVSDAAFRAEVNGFDGNKSSRGAPDCQPGALWVRGLPHAGVFCTSRPAAVRNWAR